MHMSMFRVPKKITSNTVCLLQESDILYRIYNENGCSDEEILAFISF
jgi:hypothetical protein